MSHTVMITTPALNAMEGHGLTDAALIVDGRRTAVAYSVLCPATDRYSLVTLDGRWVIPGKDGYKTRGPATTYARKNVAELRPEGLRVYEPLKHTGRPQVGRYGARRSGRCMGQVQSASVGYECGSCRVYVSLDELWREGFTVVLDGRGTHTVSYALDRNHARSFGEGRQHRVTSPEGEAAISALEIELAVIRKEADSVKGLAAEAEPYAEAAEAGKDAALDSRNVAEAYAGAVDAADASRSVALLVKLAVGRCESLDKLRTAFRKRAEAVTAEGYEQDADRLYDDVASIVDSAWEYCGVVEESQRTAYAAAEAADAEYGRRCLKCGTFYRQPARSGEGPTVPCACSALYAGSVADVTDPGTIPAPWECLGQLEFAEGEADGGASGDVAPVTPHGDAPQDMTPVAPVDDASGNVAEGAKTAPVDPGYSLDVAPGERVWSRPGWDGSYAGRAEVLRGHVSVADARAAVARFPECVKIVGGAPGVGMGCAMLHADVTRTGENAYTWGGTDGSEMIRTGDPYVVTFPDGTTVRGTWVECGAQFAEWAVTERPECVCASAEGYADGYATLAKIQADMEAERQADARAMDEAVSEAETARADLDRVWSAWASVVDELSMADADKVWDVAADGRRGLAEAERAQGSGSRWGVADGAARARAAVKWLTESARRYGLEIPEPEPVADTEPASEAVTEADETNECTPSTDAVTGAEPVATERPTEEMGTCTQQSGDAAPETEATPEAAPVATGPRVVPVAETARRARAAQAEAETVQWDAQTSVNDLADAYRERVSLALSWDQEEGMRKSLAREREAASCAASAAFQARVTADSWQRDMERAASDMEAMRARTARLFSAEGDNRTRWVSADGQTVIALALPADDDADRRYAKLLAGAIAAKDAGRTLKSTDIPNKKTHGRGPGAEFKQAVARASRPLVQPWKAPRIPAEGKPLDGETLAAWEATGVCAEVEATPGVWLPRAAVCVAETAAANGWTVAMERTHSGAVTVRAAGVLARESGPVAGEIVAVWTDAIYDADRSGAFVGGRRMAAELKRVLITVGQSAQAGDIATSGAPTGTSAPAPQGVSDPGNLDAWETNGGACLGVDRPGMPDAGRGAAPLDTDPSPEMGTCTAPAVNGTPVHPDVVSDLGAVDTWDGEGGAVPGVEAPRVCLVGEQLVPDPYAVRPAVPEWGTAPGGNCQTTALTCAGEEYGVYHAPDAVLPYTVRRTEGGADVDLGGWVGIDDVRAIVRADRRRTAALKADRRRVEQQQRRAVYRLQGEQRQAPVRLTAEDRRAIARRTEEKHRPVAAELYL